MSTVDGPLFKRSLVSLAYVFDFDVGRRHLTLTLCYYL